MLARSMLLAVGAASVSSITGATSHGIGLSLHGFRCCASAICLGVYREASESMCEWSARIRASMIPCTVAGARVCPRSDLASLGHCAAVPVDSGQHLLFADMAAFQGALIGAVIPQGLGTRSGQRTSA